MRAYHSPGSSWAKLKRNSGTWWLRADVLWDRGEEIGDSKDLERTLTPGGAQDIRIAQESES